MKKLLGLLCVGALTGAFCVACDGKEHDGVDILTKIPDPVFLAYCQSQLDEWDLNGDGKLSIKEAAKVENIYMIDINQNEGPASMEGLEYFTGLLHLACRTNLISALDVSRNTKLIELACCNTSRNNSSLTLLDVSKNSALMLLYCYGNSLTTLDVSGNPNLKSLLCHDNKLVSLDISKNTALDYLRCFGNPGDGATFTVRAWFDNSSRPERITAEGWNYQGTTITIDFQKVD